MSSEQFPKRNETIKLSQFESQQIREFLDHFGGVFEGSFSDEGVADGVIIKFIFASEMAALSILR